MNFRVVANQLGLLLTVLSLLMLLMFGAFLGIETLLEHAVNNDARNALLVSGAIGLTVGGGMWFFTRAAWTQIGRREALLLVALTWIVGAAFAALPYFVWARISEVTALEHPFRSFTNCYFEAMSGLTTTGASILSDIEAVPRSLLLWRSLTQWLGGLGIVVLFVAVLPAMGTSARKLFRAETSGLTKQGMRPQIRDTARFLWYIYLSMTVTQILLLRLAGMDWFDSVCHTFATCATGGFSTRNASIAAYDSFAIELIILIFMVLGSINFALYYHVIKGRFDVISKDPELRLYLTLLFTGTAMVAALIYNRDFATLDGEQVRGTLANSLRHASFTMVSIQTTTGFATAEYDGWSSMTKSILFLLGLIGGCAGSTSGGLKVIRLWILIKTLQAEIERAFRPNVVRAIRIGDTAISEEVRLGTLAFIAAFLVVLVACTVALMSLESDKNIDLASAASATLCCMTTIGPGVGLFGAIENYGWLSGTSKWILAMAMVIGRLEVFTILVLLVPRFWANR